MKGEASTTHDDDLDFFQEVRTSRLRSSCSLWMILVFLAGIFLALVLVFFYLRDNIKIDLGKNFSRTSQQNKSESVSGADEAVGSLITAQIDEDRLNTLFRLDEENFPLKSAKLEIMSDGIRIKGRTGSSFLSMRLELSILPEVVDGKIHYKITSFKTAGLSVPQAVVDRIEPQINEKLVLAAKETVEFKPTEVNLSPHLMEVVGVVR